MSMSSRFRTAAEYVKDESTVPKVESSPAVESAPVVAAAPIPTALDIAQLVQLVTAAVQAAQPANQNVPDLAKAITEGIAAGQPPRKIEYGEFMLTRSVHRDKPELVRRVFQNGYEVERGQLTAEDIAKVNAVYRPGRYVNGLVSVNVTPEAVNFHWNNATQDMRLQLQSQVRSFSEMLDRILASQETRPAIATEAID